jgi:hypothetical protein
MRGRRFGDRQLHPAAAHLSALSQGPDDQQANGIGERAEHNGQIQYVNRPI